MNQTTTLKNLIGKWYLACRKVRTSEGWQEVALRIREESMWEFCTNGILIEFCPVRMPSATKFYYAPESMLLTIDRSHYEEDGYMSICVEDRFRVEFIDDDHFVLYDLEEVEAEPEGYYFKLEWRRARKG